MLAAVACVIVLPEGHEWHDLDAVGGAGRQAQFAAGTAVVQDLVHEAGGADDGIDRTGEDALGAADAVCRVDAHGLAHGHRAQVVGQGQQRAVQQAGQPGDGLVAAGWAAVDGLVAPGQRLGIAPAVVIATAPALGLRQQPVDAIGQQGKGDSGDVGLGHGAL